MIKVFEGGNHPDWVDGLLDDFSKADNHTDMRFNSKGSASVLAVKDGAPVGIVMFDKDPSFRINMIHTFPDNEDTVEPMLKSIVAMAIFQGKDSVTIHSIDRNGTLTELFRNMGFKIADGCPCCHREGTIHMKLSL